MCAHNLVHEKSPDILRALYKSASFTLQAIAYLQTGQYARDKQALRALLEPEDLGILETGMTLKQTLEISEEAFQVASGALLRWFGPWASGAGLGTSFLPCVSAVSKSLLFSYTMTILAKAVTPITATQYIAETVSF